MWKVIPFLCADCVFIDLVHMTQFFIFLHEFRICFDANLDVPGTVSLANEIVALLVHTTLLDNLDLHVEEVSQFTVLYHLVRHAS
jgi:hypothetical protein